MSFTKFLKKDWAFQEILKKKFLTENNNIPNLTFSSNFIPVYF